MKSYIYQLSGGKMLVFQDGWVGVETTGYPLPDCSLKVGDKTLRGQNAVMRAILGYDVDDAQSFAQAVSNIQPMLFDDFKNKVISENIGGGCPVRVQAIQSAVRGGLSRNLALFKYVLPVGIVNESCSLPSEVDLVEEYSSLLNVNWVVHTNTPNWKFKNNIIMLTGCRAVTDKHIEFIKDVVAICMVPYERNKYRYLSAITLQNGNGALILTDSYIGNSDLAYLYQRVTFADLSVGKIDGTVDKDGNFSMHYEYVENAGKKRKYPEIHGVVKRSSLV